MGEFIEVDEFVKFKRKNKAQILKYIKLCFDKDSELRRIENFRTKQIKSCQKAKLDITSSQVLQIMNFMDDEVNVLINAYLGKVQHNNLYDSLISNQYLFWTIQEEIRKPLDDKGIKHKAELSKYAELIEQRISSLTERIYSDVEEIKEMGAKVIRMTYDQRVKEKYSV